VRANDSAAPRIFTREPIFPANVWEQPLTGK